MTTSPPAKFTIRNSVLTAPALEAGLYVVATPIGNLRDISLRALETLAAADVIACEDTRATAVLLNRYGIEGTRISYNEHNADARGPDILRQIAEGAAIALVSDAGTPLVSDPGSRLVQQAVQDGIRVIPLPGASAPLAALVGSGIGTGDFRFCGFPPGKAGARAKWLAQFSGAAPTLIFFESPARLLASLGTMAQTFGGTRRAVVARELTKLHETFYRGSLEDLIAEFEQMDRIRGEIVIVVDGEKKPIPAEADVTALLSDALTRLKTKDAAAEVAELTGLPRQQLYQQALALKKP